MRPFTRLGTILLLLLCWWGGSAIGDNRPRKSP